MRKSSASQPQATGKRMHRPSSQPEGLADEKLNGARNSRDEHDAKLYSWSINDVRGARRWAAFWRVRTSGFGRIYLIGCEAA